MWYLQHFAFASFRNNPPLFLAFRTVTYQSIKVYLAGIRHYHIENGYQDPLRDNARLRYLCKGIKRHQGESTPRRKPISVKTLTNLQDNVAHLNHLSETDKLMVFCALSMAYYGFLRASEFTSPSPRYFNRKLHLCRENVHLAPHSSYLAVLIKASKTDPYRQSTKITIAATHTPTRPVKATKKYLKHT